VTVAQHDDGGPASQAHFGRYKLIATLGHGGMADVYLAVARGPVGFNKLQVVKCLRPDLAEEEDFLAMFLDEARLAARLHHPSVVQTNEVGEAGGNYFIAMEYLDGQPLNRVLYRARRRCQTGMPLECCVSIIVDALAGLHYAHELLDYGGTPLSVVHRDASPHNIFVTYNGHVKVVDFGIAKAANRSAETRSGTLKGKIGYMAPEQARCDPVDRRADIFSIGVVLWEAVTGERMWKDANEFQILDRLSSGTPLPSLRSLRPDAPVELEAICTRALALDPAQRHATASDMQGELLAFLDTGGRRRASHDEIGRLVGELFSEERAKIKGVVDRQLTALEELSQSAEINVVDLRSLASTGSVRPPSYSSSRSIKLFNAPDEDGTAPTLARAATAESMKPRPIKRSRTATVLMSMGAATIGGVLALVLLWKPTLPADTTESEPTTGSTVAPDAGSADEDQRLAQMVHVDIEAHPAEAVISLDGKELARGHYAEAHRPDGGAHELVIQAPGYETDRRELRFDKNVQVMVVLRKTSEPTTDRPRQPPMGGVKPPPPKEPAPSGSGAEPTGVSGKPGKPKKRKLDSDDPWSD
jgi:serine/threonine protein kinase